METLALPTKKFHKIEVTMPTHRTEILAFLRTYGLFDKKKLQSNIDGPYQNSPNTTNAGEDSQ